MTQPTIREVIVKCKAHDILVEQALSTFRQILEDCVPKKTLCKHDSIPTYTDGAGEGCVICIKNQAISEIQQWIKEVWKGKGEG